MIMFILILDKSCEVIVSVGSHIVDRPYDSGTALILSTNGAMTVFLNCSPSLQFCSILLYNCIDLTSSN